MRRPPVCELHRDAHKAVAGLLPHGLVTGAAGLAHPVHGQPDLRDEFRGDVLRLQESELMNDKRLNVVMTHLMNDDRLNVVMTQSLRGEGASVPSKHGCVG